MIKTIFTICCIFILNACAIDADIQKSGINVEYQDENGDEQILLLKRNNSKGCNNIKFEPKNIWNSKYVETNIKDKCKVSVVTTIGSISAIKFDGIETYGELEVLEFIKQSQENQNYLLVDTRSEKWFFHSTIATSVNIPFTYFSKSRYPDEFIDTLHTIGVIINKDGTYNFKDTKTLLLFCNGAWCGQSVTAIEYLVKIGYPKDKIFWYRGGIQSWKMLGLPTISQ